MTDKIDTTPEAVERIAGAIGRDLGGVEVDGQDVSDTIRALSARIAELEAESAAKSKVLAITSGDGNLTLPKKAVRDMVARAEAAEVKLSEMRRERDQIKTEARQWKADQRKAMSDYTILSARVVELEAKQADLVRAALKETCNYTFLGIENLIADHEAINAIVAQVMEKE